MSIKLLGLLVSMTAAAASLSARAEEIKIGEVGSMTGDQATFGTSTHQGIELAIEQVNAKGGVKGNKLKLFNLDDQGQAAEAATATTKLITQTKVVAVLGEVASSISLAMAPVAQQYKIPMITPSSTNPEVTKKGNYIFRVCFIDPFQGTVMAKFAAEHLKAKKVAILREVTSDYSMGLANFFAEAFKKSGGTITSDQSYSNKDMDFKAQLTSLKGQNPDAIFVPGYYNQVGLIARQAKQLGIKAPLMGGDGWDSPKLKEIAGKAIDGSYFANHYSEESKEPEVVNFIKAYKAKWGSIPDGLAAMGYDAAMVLVAAMEKAKDLKPASIRDAIAETKGHLGVTGKITLDKDRNPTKPAVVLKVDNGAFKYQTTIHP